MRLWTVTLGKGGSGTFSIEINAATPDEARNTAKQQYPNYRVQSVRAVY